MPTRATRPAALPDTDLTDPLDRLRDLDRIGAIELVDTDAPSAYALATRIDGAIRVLTDRIADCQTRLESEAAKGPAGDPAALHHALKAITLCRSDLTRLCDILLVADESA